MQNRQLLSIHTTTYYSAHIFIHLFIHLFEIEIEEIHRDVKHIDEWSRPNWMMCLCFIRKASASLLEFIFIPVVSYHASVEQLHVMNKLSTAEKKLKENTYANIVFNVLHSFFSISVIQIHCFFISFWLPVLLKALYIFLLCFIFCHHGKNWHYYSYWRVQ